MTEIYSSLISPTSLANTGNVIQASFYSGSGAAADGHRLRTPTDFSETGKKQKNNKQTKKPINQVSANEQRCARNDALAPMARRYKQEMKNLCSHKSGRRRRAYYAIVLQTKCELSSCLGGHMTGAGERETPDDYVTAALAMHIKWVSVSGLDAAVWWSPSDTDRRLV